MRGGQIAIMVLLFGLLAGCANISAPTGGKKDITPPKLVRLSPADSLLNTRVKRLELYFDEYITLAEPSKEITISPILQFAPTAVATNKHVVVTIADTLLEENTTYRVSFGSAVRDLHEGNPFTKYTYTFSTGGYFDSLSLEGSVLNAATGIPDTSGMLVVLYKSTENDTAIIRKKPMYAVKPDRSGKFRFTGLPGRDFRLYAIRDDNNNMMYDGGVEMVAFNDDIVRAGDTSIAAPVLRLFPEVADSANAVADTAASGKKGMRTKQRMSRDTGFFYSLNVDSADIGKRTFDVTDSFRFVFNVPVVLHDGGVHLSRDSGGVWVPVPFKVRQDVNRNTRVNVIAELAGNAVYELIADSAFVTDTAGKAIKGARYRFRTMDRDDYGKIKLEIPGRYSAKGQKDGFDHILMMTAGADTVYQERITDSVVVFKRLKPATYTFRIIADKDGNGKWSTGDLLGRKQPEIVFPGPQPLVLKAGWDHTLEFEQKPKAAGKTDGGKDNKSTKNR
ncbi:MAG: Ig-like domain-containing protein [Chitinophagaceae bacterium]|nr:Ig-like domain-containing protein [Chitinophagaceae bacterium]